MIFVIIILYIGIVAIEVPGMIKKKQKRELLAFSVFLLIGLSLFIFTLDFHLHIPKIIE